VTASSGTVPAEDERIPANRLRSVAAKRLTESQAVPHFFLTSVVDVERLLSFRKEVNAGLESQGVKVSVNDLLVRAAALALRLHPDANSSWAGDKLLRHGHVNVGIAVATPTGLLVPVVADADRKSLSEIAVETVSLAGKARDGKLKLNEMSGGTFSISNLGMFGIDQFTAVINPPEAAILAVGAASPVPVLRDGALMEVPKLKITLTVDHRVMDGAVAAAFLRELVDILEQPLRIVI
jgi:pyruvate dehydrogenase E2 component (dihydrolipoamide acetyltransferase)